MLTQLATLECICNRFYRKVKSDGIIEYHDPQTDERVSYCPECGQSLAELNTPPFIVVTEKEQKAIEFEREYADNAPMAMRSHVGV